MTNIVKNISHLVETQFPQVYQNEGKELVAFVKAYYEFLETTNQATKLSREMFDTNDIDDTLDQFIIHFKEKYLKDFPFISTTDKRFLIKNIIDLYSSKGSEESIKLLMRMLFNEDIDVYYPGQDIFKPSDSTWFLPKYIELSESTRSKDFVNKQITGGISGATAFVESIVTKRIDGRIIDVLYLSSIKGQFIYGEFITDDGDLTNSPKITGSMTGITITNGGQGNEIGDIYNVESQGGRQGQIRVTAVSNETGRVNFELVDGGAGYTLNGQQAIDAGHENFLTTSTNVYISDRVLSYTHKKYTRQEIYNELLYIDTIYDNNTAAIATLEDSISKPFAVSLSEFYAGFAPSSTDKQAIYDFLTEVYYNDVDLEYYLRYDFDEAGTNHVPGEATHLSGILDGTWDSTLKDYLTDYGFINFEKVSQPAETIGLYSADDIKNDIRVGDFIFGYSGSNPYNSTPGSEIAKGVIIKFQDSVTDELQFDIVIQPETGTFLEQIKIEAGVSDFTDDNVGENIEEETAATAEITYVSANTFSVNDLVYQQVIEWQEDSASTIASGTIYTILSSGNTNFIAVGAADNSVGTQFTASSTFDAEGINAGTGTVRSAETPYYISSYGEGRVTQVNGTTLTLDKVFGTFQDSVDNIYSITTVKTGIDAAGNSQHDVVAWSRNYTVTDLGARGKLTDVTSDPAFTDLYVDITFGSFTTGKELRGDKSFYKADITNVLTGQGVSDVYLNNTETANGILNEVSDTSAIGYVTNSNTSAVGLHTISGEFYSNELINSFTPIEVATNILRRVVGLDTPNKSTQQVLWDRIISTEQDPSNPYEWGTTDALDVLKFYTLGRMSSSPGVQLVGEFLTEKFYVKTSRDELISPPRDGSGTIIEIEKQLLGQVSQGEGASFEPGSLENEEDIFLYTDLIGGVNVNDVRFTDIEIDGQGSGVGFLDSIQVIHYELKGYDGVTANRKIYVLDVAEDVTSLFADGDGLTLTRTDGSTVPSTSIEVLDSAWVQYNIDADTTTTKNKIVIAMDASEAAPLPCDSLTGPLPSSNVTGVVKSVQIDTILPENTYIIQGDYSSIAATAATADVTDLGSDMYGQVLEWKSDTTNSRVYIKLDGDLFDSSNNFTTSDQFYAKLVLNSAEVVYLRLGVLDVVDTRVTPPGSQTITLEGGGFAGGDPLVPAAAQLNYDALIGYIDDTTVVDPGSNYYTDATIPTTYAWTLETWTGVQGGLPFLRPRFDYGYGFGLKPQGDQDTPLEEILKSGTFTIGTITSLTNINPGSLYNADPFINVINPYVAAYKRANYTIRIVLTSDIPFQVGETVTQTVANIQSDKGTILEARSDELVMNREAFSVTFTDGVELVGGTSGATATIITVINSDANYWGTNAIVTSDVVVATGVATDIEVISSGFGYNPNEVVTMVSEDGSNQFIITGTSKLVNQGTGRGFWRTFNSHLNYDKKIRDNDFYQEFSYQVLSGQSLNRYEQILKDTLHVAGTKMFGGVVYESEVSGAAKVESLVDQVALIEYQLIDENDLVLGADDTQPLLVTKEVIRDV